MSDIINRLKLTERKDGYIISTIISLDYKYGKYETALSYKGFPIWRILEGYNSKDEALRGHEKYSDMSEEELNKIDFIG